MFIVRRLKRAFDVSSVNDDGMLLSLQLTCKGKLLYGAHGGQAYSAFGAMSTLFLSLAWGLAGGSIATSLYNEQDKEKRVNKHLFIQK